MKIALITGASSGLGVKYADAVIEKYPELDEIWLVARRQARLESYAAEHPQVRIRPVALDLWFNEISCGILPKPLVAASESLAMIMLLCPHTP